MAYWEFFRRLGLDDADLTADKGALGPLEVIGPVGEPWKPTPKSKLRQTWRYRFVPQDYDIGPRSRLYDPKLHREHPGETWKTWLVRGGLHAIDDANAAVDLNWPPDVEPAHPEALVPLDIFNDTEQRAALLALGEWVAANGVDADGPWRAGRDLLLRRPPRCGQGEGVRFGCPTSRASTRRAGSSMALATAFSPSRARPAPARPTPAPAWSSAFCTRARGSGSAPPATR